MGVFTEVLNVVPYVLEKKKPMLSYSTIVLYIRDIEGVGANRDII